MQSLQSLNCENAYYQKRKFYNWIPEKRPDPRKLGCGEFISGAILFEETLYQKAPTGELMTELLAKEGIIPGMMTVKQVPCFNSTQDTVIRLLLCATGYFYLLYRLHKSLNAS